MIRITENYYTLETENTAYCFCVTATGHLAHIYYGRKLFLPEAEELRLQTLRAITQRNDFAPANTVCYDPENQGLSLEKMPLEMSSLGKGDVREPFLDIVHADGSSTSDFLFDSARIVSPEPDFWQLPHSYDEKGNGECLQVTLKDRQYALTLRLYYWVYPDCDVITRSASLENSGGSAVTLRRLMSAQVELPGEGYVVTNFTGAWGREMQRTDTPLWAGKFVNASCAGTSSSRANPFVMLSRQETTEDHGDCYGFNLIYSGNHYSAAEVGSYGATRFVCGIHPQTFCFAVAPGERLDAPEAVMTYSCRGFNGMSQGMHRFVREHVARGQWKHKLRPVLLNSWEAAYFQIDEETMLELSRSAKALGVELIVMDDGWFGARDDDTCSLGDWVVNRKKFPHGLDWLSREINRIGLAFGIWVEPEMVSVNSELYRAHPDWALQIPGKPHSQGRNQRILDLTRREVQDHLIDAMTKVFSGANIAYVKWDMNRIFSDYYSAALPQERQGEVAHRYVLGLYRCMKTLTERFPEILFEGCSAGGNRFDLGILSYFPQIWASDNTDGLCRAQMQHNYSYGYPMSAVSAHVSDCPNHQTRRSTPLETRFHTASFGVCGYECSFPRMSESDRTAIREQIDLYKQLRQTLQYGAFYRCAGEERPGSVLRQTQDDLRQWCCVSPDQKTAVGFVMQGLTVPNTFSYVYHARGLRPEWTYRIGIAEEAGSENARWISGDALMGPGIQMEPDAAAGGRFFQDFGSRMYRIDAMA